MYNTLTTEEGELHCDSVSGVDRDIDETYAGPHEADGGGGSLSLHPKIESDGKRQKNLESRPHRYLQEFTEEKKQHVAGLMENEINIIDEMPLRTGTGIVQRIDSGDGHAD